MAYSARQGASIVENYIKTDAFKDLKSAVVQLVFPFGKAPTKQIVSQTVYQFRASWSIIPNYPPENVTAL